MINFKTEGNNLCIGTLSNMHIKLCIRTLYMISDLREHGNVNKPAGPTEYGQTKVYNIIICTTY